MSLSNEIDEVVSNISSMENKKTSEVIKQVLVINKLYDKKFSIFEDILKDVIKSVESLTDVAGNNAEAYVMLSEVIGKVIGKCIDVDNRLSSDVEELKNKINN